MQKLQTEELLCPLLEAFERTQVTLAFMYGYAGDIKNELSVLDGKLRLLPRFVQKACCCARWKEMG